MIKIENVVLPSDEQWTRIIQGTRNPKNSWDRSDSDYRRILCDRCDNCLSYQLERWEDCDNCEVDTECKTHDGFMIGPNDHKLMMSLAAGGPVHAKYRRMIMVYLDITAPLYWWKEYDTYKIGTVANSCSTMHKIHEKEFTLEDFSAEHLVDDGPLGDNKAKELEEAVKNCDDYSDACTKEDGYFCFDNETGYLALAVPFNDTSINTFYYSPKSILKTFIIPVLNANREAYLKTKDKKYWWQMIQLLPSSYNQKRTVMLNYEVLAGIYQSRKNHKLDEWHAFCDWIKTLPYSELITGEVGLQV